MPPVNVPVPGTVKPVELRANISTPKIVKPNSPRPGRKIPVDVSEEKFRDGAPAVPSTSEMFAAPAAMVVALSKFTESHSKITC